MRPKPEQMSLSRVVSRLKARSPRELGQYGLILIRNALGFSNELHNPDREVLEKVVLAEYAKRHDLKSVLFVGCDWYTRHYEKLFPGREYLTLDFDAWKKQFGSARHIIAGLEDIEAHVSPASLDLIICNGVFGWGLDSNEACEKAFNGCFNALRPNGELVIGWNDKPESRPLDLGSLASLARFDPLVFEAFGSHQYLANPDNMHTFNFYKKQQGTPQTNTGS